MSRFLAIASKIVLTKITFPFILIFVVIGLTSWGTVSITRKNPEIFGLVKGPSILQKEQQELIARVGKLIDLPKDETPTVATVTDLKKLKNQTFFKNAALEDKVIIYTNAKKAILFRPSENRIIEVGVLNINQQGTEEATTESPSPSASPEGTVKPEESPQESPKP